MIATTDQNIEQALISVLEKVSDPEIPVLSIMDMGVVRSALIINGKVIFNRFGINHIDNPRIFISGI